MCLLLVGQAFARGGRGRKLAFLNVTFVGLVSLRARSCLRGCRGIAFFLTSLLKHELIEHDSLIDHIRKGVRSATGNHCTFDIWFESIVEQDAFCGIVQVKGGCESLETLGILQGRTGLRQSEDFVFGLKLICSVSINVCEGCLERWVIVPEYVIRVIDDLSCPSEGFIL